jgi:hypothetical protein
VVAFLWCSGSLVFTVERSVKNRGEYDDVTCESELLHICDFGTSSSPVGLVTPARPFVREQEISKADVSK